MSYLSSSGMAVSALFPMLTGGVAGHLASWFEDKFAGGACIFVGIRVDWKGNN